MLRTFKTTIKHIFVSVIIIEHTHIANWELMLISYASTDINEMANHWPRSLLPLPAHWWAIKITINSQNSFGNLEVNK